MSTFEILVSALLFFIAWKVEKICEYLGSLLSEIESTKEKMGLNDGLSEL